MNNLLIHTTDKKYDILKPQGREKCIYLSRNTFVGDFGKYIYLFDEKVMFKNFPYEEVHSGGAAISKHSPYNRHVKYSFVSQPLKTEIRIYNSINVEQYAVGVITAFNFFKGMLEKTFSEEIIAKENINLIDELTYKPQYYENKICS